MHCPTLIVVGDEDVLTPRALSEEMQAAAGRQSWRLFLGRAPVEPGAAGHVQRRPARLRIGYSRIPCALSGRLPDTITHYGHLALLVLAPRPPAGSPLIAQNSFDLILTPTSGTALSGIALAERRRLISSVAALAGVWVDRLREAQLAFWANAQRAGL